MGRSYAVESYLPRAGAGELREVAARARAAAEELTALGQPIRYLRSLYLPSDETCFHLFDASDAAIVGEASSRACLAHNRIVEALQ
jgi:hypothetical protein